VGAPARDRRPLEGGFERARQAVGPVHTGTHLHDDAAHIDRIEPLRQERTKLAARKVLVVDLAVGVQTFAVRDFVGAQESADSFRQAEVVDGRDEEPAALDHPRGFVQGGAEVVRAREMLEHLRRERLVADAGSNRESADVGANETGVHAERHQSLARHLQAPPGEIHAEDPTDLRTVATGDARRADSEFQDQIFAPRRERVPGRRDLRLAPQRNEETLVLRRLGVTQTHLAQLERIGGGVGLEGRGEVDDSVLDRVVDRAGDAAQGASHDLARRLVPERERPEAGRAGEEFDPVRTQRSPHGPRKQVSRSPGRSDGTGSGGRSRSEGERFGAVGLWLAAAFAIVIAALTFDRRLYINGDNVDYIFLARAVRAGDFWPSDKYPPLFPLLLAPVQLLFGMALIPQKLLVLALYAGSVGWLLRIVARRVGGAAPWVLGIAATLIPVIEYAHYTMSEIPFLFFLLGAIDALDRRAKNGPIWRDRALWEAALWTAAACYTRSAGIAAVPGLALAATLGRGKRGALVYSTATLVCLIPWAVRSALTPGGNPYFEQFARVNPYYPQLGTLDASSLLARLLENSKIYFLQEMPVTLAPVFFRSTNSPHGIRDAYFPWFVALLLLAPLAVGLAVRLRARDAVAGVVVGSLALSCLWPPIWSGTRFLAPLTPLLFLLFWSGLEVGIRRLAPRAGAIVRTALLTLWVLVGVKNLAGYVDEIRAYPPEWDRYFTALRWIRDNTPADAVVLDRKPAFVEYVAERKSVTFPRESDADAMLAEIRRRGATHIVLSGIPYDDISRYLVPAIERRSERFIPVFELSGPPTYVLVWADDAANAPSAR